MAAAVALLPCLVTPVYADQINTPGSDCQQAITGVGKLIYLSNGGARFVADPGFTSTRMVCPIPRTPLAAGTADRIFYIDGNNPAGGTTSCTITVYDYLGTAKDSFPNSSSANPYDMPFVIPAASLSQYDYVIALCSVPNGGTLRGVASKD
jgi:hypothetical protein